MAENTNPAEAVAVTVTEEKNTQAADQDSTDEKMPEKVLQAKNVAGLLNILSFVLSLPLLAFVVWLLYMKDYDCENLLKLPKYQIGIAIGMIFVFLISNLALFLRSRLPMPGLIVVMVPLIVMLTMGLGIVGAYEMASRSIPASPMWFKLKVRDPNNWNNIKSCIYDRGVCDDLASRSMKLRSYDFDMKKLSSIESGCCKPPETCGLEYVNASFWERKDEEEVERSNYPHDQDCDHWKNDHNILCYDCQSCKHGFLKTLQSKWWKLGIFLVLMSLLLILSHLFLFFATIWESFAG